jgi:hypothetical protein
MLTVLLSIGTTSGGGGASPVEEEDEELLSVSAVEEEEEELLSVLAVDEELSVSAVEELSVSAVEELLSPVDEEELLSMPAVDEEEEEEAENGQEMSHVHVAPTDPLSTGPPIVSVLPSAESATDVPCLAPAVASAPVSLLSS